MSFKIAIASGKGGTGKTTVSVNLYQYMKDNICDSIKLVDCDVEEPNCKLFFPNLSLSRTEAVNQIVPFIDDKKCIFCKKCVDYCEFNAISIITNAKYAKVNTDLCHSCGACLVACEFDAITEHPLSIGEINYFKPDKTEQIAEGRLKIGSAMQTLLIKELKKNTSDTTDLIIYDAPPGTSCPVVETVADADYVILVTEPTPFGLHDLKLTVELLAEIKKPFGVIVNKAGLGTDDVYKYLKQNSIELLGEIPFNKEYASLYAEGKLLDSENSIMEEYYQIIAKNLERKILVFEGDKYFKQK